MEEKIQKCIIDYFSFFEEFYNTSKKILKDCHKCAISINKLIVRINNIKEAALGDTPLEIYPGIKNRLCVKLYDIISEETQEIKHNCSSLEELFETLCNKHRSLQDNCRYVDFSQPTALITGTSLQPPLAKLLRFSTEALNFAGQLCAQIDTSLSVLAYKKLDTVSFADCFRIPHELQSKIPEILAYTAYVSENTP